MANGVGGASGLVSGSVSNQASKAGRNSGRNRGEIEVGELVLVGGRGVDPLEEGGDVDLGLGLGETLGAGSLDAQRIHAAEAFVVSPFQRLAW